jgi:hypothetical protein
VPKDPTRDLYLLPYVCIQTVKITPPKNAFLYVQRPQFNIFNSYCFYQVWSCSECKFGHAQNVLAFEKEFLKFAWISCVVCAYCRLRQSQYNLPFPILHRFLWSLYVCIYVCSSCNRLKNLVNNSFPVATDFKNWHIVLPEDDKIVQKYVGDAPFIFVLIKIVH